MKKEIVKIRMEKKKSFFIHLKCHDILRYFLQSSINGLEVYKKCLLQCTNSLVCLNTGFFFFCY